MNDKAYDKKVIEFENKLKPELTDEFLSVLIKAAKTSGWSVDHTEIVSFVNWCFDIAGEKRPEREDLISYVDMD